MTASGNFKISRIRSRFLFGLGAHLAVNGLLLLAVYYLVMEISVNDARELLDWIVPAAQGCCVFAAILLAAGLTGRDSQAPRDEQTSSRGWMIGKIMPIGRGAPRTDSQIRTLERKHQSVDVERTLSLLKGIDWKVFRDLAKTYFRELGFRVVEETERYGVDFLLYTEDDYSAVAVRCLPWGTERVDLKQVRHIHRAMLLAGASQGVMLTTGVFDEEALAFGEGKALEMLDGDCFVSRLLSLPPGTSEKLLQEAAGAESIRRGQKMAVPEGLLFKSS